LDFQIRDRSVNQGRKKLRAEREEYFRLMQLEYSNKEACRIVGINLRTGREKRNGRTSPNRTVTSTHTCSARTSMII
jgi:IS30 family transposase